MDSNNGSTPEATTAGSAHARDLGYLDKFLEKLRSQAAAMSPGEARTRLEVLLNEEADRWREIAALLETGVGQPSAMARRPAPQSPAAAPPKLEVRPAWRPRATIGSLKQTPR